VGKFVHVGQPCVSLSPSPAPFQQPFSPPQADWPVCVYALHALITALASVVQSFPRALAVLPAGNRASTRAPNRGNVKPRPICKAFQGPRTSPKFTAPMAR
jgi:hypothetical protein